MKKKQDVNQAESNTTQTPRKKKASEKMSSVLPEFALEPAIEEFTKNEQFISTYKDETVYIGLFLDVNDIGGLSRKTNKDEAKGSIVEHIKSGHIKVLITQQLLEDEKIVIIPDADTIECMSEYMLFAGAPYRICYVTKKGDIIVTDKQVNLSDIDMILHSGERADSVLFVSKPTEQSEEQPEEKIEEKVEEPIETQTDIIEKDEVTQESFDDSDFISPDDDVSYEDTPVYEEEPVFDEEYNIAPSDYAPDDNQDNNSDDGAFDDIEDYGDAQNIDEDLTEKFEQTVVRKFYSDDLGLEISTEPFDLQFMHMDTYVPFVEDRGDGWLNEYLSNMAMNANAEMSRMHKDNLFRIRDKYFTLISTYCEDVQKKLDLNNPSTLYGKLNAGLKQQRYDAKKALADNIIIRKKELDDNWNKKLEQVGEDASRLARQQYRERFGEAHEAEILKVESDMTQKIEDDYQDGVRLMNSDRKKDALKLLDLGVNATLQEITSMYGDMLTEEQVRYRQLQQEMLDFIDDNRKDEIARIRALEEEQSRVNKANEAMREASERIKQMQAEFEANKSLLQDEMDKLEREHKARLEANKQDCDARVTEANNEKKALQARIDELLVRITEIDEKKDREYASRINELTQQNAAWEDKCEHIVAMNKKSNIIAYFLMGVSIIAAIAIGIIAGYAFGSNDSHEIAKQSQQTAVVQEQAYDDYISFGESDM